MIYAYVLGLLVMLFMAAVRFLSDRVVRLSDLVIALSLIFCSWVGVILYIIGRVMYAIEYRKGEIILHDWREDSSDV